MDTTKRTFNRRLAAGFAGAAIAGTLFAPNGAASGAYCVQIFDCPTGATGCTSQLTEAVNYSMTVKHY